MPDQGRLTQERLPAVAPAISPLYPKPPWPLPGARTLKLLYETDTEPVLTWLPPKLTRSSPPYAVLTVTHYPETPIGPFSLAAQHIGCRAGFFIRAFTVQAITDSPAALAALREVWGYPCKLGSVTLDAQGGEVTATVSHAGDTVAEASLAGGSPVDGGSVRLDPVLNVRTAPSLEPGKLHDLLQVVQIDPDSEPKEAVRGSGLLVFPSQSEAAPWHLLPMRNMVAAVYCTVDTELPLARFVMPY
jgi:acetoacetate decarboxylase